MGRTYPKPRKSQTPAQKDALERARKQLRANKKNVAPATVVAKLSAKVQLLEERALDYQAELKETKRKYWNERKRARKYKEVCRTQKREMKMLSGEAYHLRGALDKAEKEVARIEKLANRGHEHLQEEIKTLEAEKRTVAQERTSLKKKCRRLLSALKMLREYTPDRLDLSLDTWYQREWWKEMINRQMSKRTVKRAVLEGGVAADIQLAYEMLNSDKLTFSSDSTSHEHIEYEVRTIAVRVLDYSDPDAEPQWCMRSMGVGTSIDHTSETQMNGLRKRLEDIAAIFNSSPLAKREALSFSPDDFAYRLIGTSGDHAADQQKSHRLLALWRMDVILQRMGEEALFAMDPMQLVEVLLPFKQAQVAKCGGKEAWELLPDEEKTKLDIELI
ncbi:hypothetical protein NP233_g11354 [Leucocoprinus birnbaumii]|uniref:Uncharacterized protein n=1 Tax=Leucocoprinus birnbaumii TaxID=56174 RepID=A0AAD5VHJ8_9AGAR|nr:hypothetical protein NP233_g11354 [Leucocoprinus birnbaumii]